MTITGITHKRRGARLLASLLTAAVASLAVLAFASSALATPKGEFVVFSDCPVTNPSVTTCLFAQTTSGEFKIGATEVPLAKTVTLQGGINGETGDIVGATDGNTLSKTPQTVPGGLLKILAPSFFGEPLSKIFNEFINKGITGVNATAELVAKGTINPTALFTKEGAGLILPLRVHLENGFLGSKCFVGSASHPVVVELTTGTTSPPPPNTPITGALGEVGTKAEGEILVITKNSLVNNTFAAPVAEGCGSQILFGIFTGIIDSAVDAQLGLPSASGHNTAILNGHQELSSSESVIASE